MPRPRKSPARLSVLALEAREVPAALTYEEWLNTPVHVGEELNQAAEVPVGPVANWMEGNTQIGLDQAFANYPYRGAGYSVAVLDTGINYNHAALGGGWGNRVKAGYDFHNNDADPMDDNGHGTHVAGIIGSSNATYNGVAPNVDLIALKVLGANGSGSFGAVEQALQWVIANRATHNIVAINLSLGSGNYNSNPFTFLDDEFTALKNAGVFVATAAGNSFYSYGSAPGLGYPAVSPLTVSVGAVWTGNVGGAGWGDGAQDYTTGMDRVTSFSQRNANLGIMAPGARLTSAGVGGNFVTMSGTSMAAPVVAGAAAVLRQAIDATGQPALANQDAILNLMRTTGATVLDGDDENDNVTNTGLSFKRLNIKGALDQIAISANHAPVIATIADQTMTPKQVRTLTLWATDVDGDAVTFSATAGDLATPEYQLKQQHGLYTAGNLYLNLRGANEKYLQGTGGAWYFLLPDGKFHKWNSTISDGTLLATLSPASYADPSRLYNAAAPTAPNATVSVSGNQLTIDPADNWSGTFPVTVTATDGKTPATRTFLVSVANQAPTLAAVADQTMGSRQDTLTLPLSGADADGDTLTYSASVASSNSQTYQLDQQHGLYFGGNYHLNLRGANEKYLQGTGGAWYFLLPDGKFYKWNSTINDGTLLATLTPAIYADPGLLYNAPAPTGGNVSATATLNGTTLTLDPVAGQSGTFTVNVSASDGLATATQSFVVTVLAGTPTLATVADQAMSPSQGSLAIDLAGTDPDGDVLTYSATVAGGNALAYQLDQQHGLYTGGNLYLNQRGANEKYLQGTGGAWYFLLPDGKFYKWNSTINDGTLLATLSPALYADPSLLYNAPAGGGPAPATATVSGNRVTVTPTPGTPGRSRSPSP
jgi:subtilisin family serine protease